MFETGVETKLLEGPDPNLSAIISTSDFGQLESICLTL